MVDQLCSLLTTANFQQLSKQPDEIILPSSYTSSQRVWEDMDLIKRVTCELSTVLEPTCVCFFAYLRVGLTFVPTDSVVADLRNASGYGSEPHSHSQCGSTWINMDQRGR